MKYFLILILILIPGYSFAAGNKATLTLAIGKQKRMLTVAELLANPNTQAITVENDVSYGKTMRYQAIPFTALIDGMKIPPGSVIEAIASDGFAATLPLGLMLQNDKKSAEAFVAIEPPDAPWPALPGKKASAGPFSIVWLRAGASGVRSEQWPYMVVTLRSADSPAKQWKEIAVDENLPATSSIRAGQDLYVTQCMACHKLNGAGHSTVGPELNLPHNPTEYFKIDALKKYIRDPASLRQWPEMKMPGFDKKALSDHEIDLIVAYLEYMAGRKASAGKKDGR